VVGFIKGKSAIHLARVYGEKRGNFWARGYFVSAVGRDQEVIRESSEAGRGRHAAGATEPPGANGHF
jgi:REP element-mobilizing transposase RayT